MASLISIDKNWISRHLISEVPEDVRESYYLVSDEDIIIFENVNKPSRLRPISVFIRVSDIMITPYFQYSNIYLMDYLRGTYFYVVAENKANTKNMVEYYSLI